MIETMTEFFRIPVVSYIFGVCVGLWSGWYITRGK